MKTMNMVVLCVVVVSGMLGWACGQLQTASIASSPTGDLTISLGSSGSLMVQQIGQTSSLSVATSADMSALQSAISSVGTAGSVGTVSIIHPGRFSHIC